MKIIKKDLCEKVYEKNRNHFYITKLRKIDVQIIIDTLFEQMINELMKGNTIELRGFGTFERTIKKARYYAMNPRTFEEVKTKDYYKISFHQGKKLKNLMKEIPIQNKN